MTSGAAGRRFDSEKVIRGRTREDYRRQRTSLSPSGPRRHLPDRGRCIVRRPGAQAQSGGDRLDAEAPALEARHYLPAGRDSSPGLLGNPAFQPVGAAPCPESCARRGLSHLVQYERREGPSAPARPGSACCITLPAAPSGSRSDLTYAGQRRSRATGAASDVWSRRHASLIGSPQRMTATVDVTA
jgi:hypothetical protein